MSDEPPADPSASIGAIFSELPYAALLGIEITEAAEGHASGELELREALRRDADAPVAHGGVTFALADTVAGAAMVSRTLDVTPTVDMRIDYRAPARTDLTATADVVDVGDDVATVDVVVTRTDGACVATARGTFKAGGSAGTSPWTAVPADDAPE